MAIQTCSQRPPRVSDIASLHLTLHVATFSSLWQNKSLQVCHTLWFNFWICPPSWNFVPGIRHSCWSCSYWPSSVHPVAVDGVEGIGDSWSSQRLSLPMEPIKFPATVWRVSKLDHCFPFPPLKGTVFVYLKLNVLPCAQLLSWWIARTSMTTITVCYTPSQGTMPRHLFTWTGENPWHRCVELCRGSELHYITSSSLVVFQVVQDWQEGLSQGKDHRGEWREESVKIVEAAQWRHQQDWR